MDYTEVGRIAPVSQLMLQFGDHPLTRDRFHAVPIYDVEECRSLVLRDRCNGHRQRVRLSPLWQQIEVLKLSRSCSILRKIHDVSTAERPQAV